MSTTKLKLVVDNGKIIDQRAKVWAEGLEIIKDRVKIQQEIRRLKDIDLKLATKLQESEDKLKTMRGKSNVIGSRKEVKHKGDIR